MDKSNSSILMSLGGKRRRKYLIEIVSENHSFDLLNVEVKCHGGKNKQQDKR